MISDHRQCFVIENLWSNFDDGALCGASMVFDRGEDPIPLKHILPQRFTTPLLMQTLRKIDQLPRSTEANVRSSTDTRIIELVPGLRDVRKKTLPQMYFDQRTFSEEHLEE